MPFRASSDLHESVQAYPNRGLANLILTKPTFGKFLSDRAAPPLGTVLASSGSPPSRLLASAQPQGGSLQFPVLKKSICVVETKPERNSEMDSPLVASYSTL